MSALAEFQASFASDLLVTHSDGGAKQLSHTDAALTIYRNTVMKGLVDALSANYPTVQQLVGEAWFKAAATCFARQSPPTNPVLAEYGIGFAEFLENFIPARELPYLNHVARLDQLWIEVYFAADVTHLLASALQSLTAEQLLATHLTMHTAARCCACKHSAVTIWTQHHSLTESPISLNIDDVDEYALITRVNNNVQLLPLNSGEYSFLSSIAAGESLGAAAIATLEHDPQFPLAQTLARLINDGCFAEIINQVNAD